MGEQGEGIKERDVVIAHLQKARAWHRRFLREKQLVEEYLEWETEITQRKDKEEK